MSARLGDSITPAGNVWHCLRALGEILHGNEWPTAGEVFDS